MFLWHVAGAIFLFRWVFRDPKVDVRFLAVGAILPNLIDKPLGTLIAPQLGSDRLVGHSLLFGTMLMVAVLIATRRGRRRRRWMALAVGALFHLVLDGMWASGPTFLWPFLGWEFQSGPQPYWQGFVGRELDIVTVLQELAGGAYLVTLWLRSGLTDPDRRRNFFATGRIPLPSA